MVEYTIHTKNNQSIFVRSADEELVQSYLLFVDGKIESIKHLKNNHSTYFTSLESYISRDHIIGETLRFKSFHEERMLRVDLPEADQIPTL